MTLGEVIAWCDRVKPNRFTNADKTMWINEVESIVQLDVLLLREPDLRFYDFSEDKDSELLACPPYDKLYRAYLVAKIDEANGEYNKYANTYQTYNNAIGEYQRYIARVYNPAEHPLKILNDSDYFIRGATAAIQFDLPVAQSDIAALTVNMLQETDGTWETVLSFDMADASFEDHLCTVTLSQEQSLMLRAGFVKVAVVIVSTDDRRMESWPWKKIRVRETSENQVVSA